MRWHKNNKTKFVFHLNTTKTEEVLTQIELTRQNITNIAKESINGICDSVGDISTESANKSFRNTSIIIDNDESHDHKSWFGPHCQNA